MAHEGNIDQASVGESGRATFDVLFRGDIAPGNSVDKVRERIAENFKLDEAAINQLFSGAVISLKHDIDRAAAERIHQRLSDAGALANIVPSISNQPDPDNQSNDKNFTVAPLGSDVLKGADIAEEDPLPVSLDHLGLQPIGSNIIEESERETIEPQEVDISHLSLE